MITELSLQNWKSFSDAKLYIDPITILIGTNASGKSNIFDALGLLSKLAFPLDITEIVTQVRGGGEGIIRRGEQECRLAICVETDKSTERLNYSITLALDTQRNVFIKEETLELENTKRDVILFARKDLMDNNPSLVNVDLYTSEGKSRNEQFTAHKSVLSQIEYIKCVKRLKEAAQEVTTCLKQIRYSNPVPERMREFTSLSQTLADDASNLAGFLAQMDPEKQGATYEAILRYLRPLPERDIQGLRAEKIPMTDRAMLYCKEGWGTTDMQEQSAMGMSDGTLRFAGIITTLVTAQPHSLVMLEELDKGLHPSRAKHLVQMLKQISRDKQLDLICTTHNATFVDELGPEMIPYISYVKRDDEQGCTRIHLLEHHGQLARLMAGGTVGDMMVQDNL